jgi:uncharacterized protein YbjQ (UPF0145 family)
MSSSKTDSKAKSKPDTETIKVPSCFLDTHGVITSTMNDLPGYRVVKILGTVYGITVRSRNWGADIGAFLKSSVGGEIRYFTNLMYSSRDKALERLVGECLARGGNAVVALRFDTSEVSCSFFFGFERERANVSLKVNTFSQVCAYGTACLVERIEDGERKDVLGANAGDETINSMQRF